MFYFSTASCGCCRYGYLYLHVAHVYILFFSKGTQLQLTAIDDSLTESTILYIYLCIYVFSVCIFMYFYIIYLYFLFNSGLVSFFYCTLLIPCYENKALLTSSQGLL